MKTINKILWHAALPLTFVACQNEDIVTGNAGQEAEVYTLQGIMDGNCQSRAQVELNRTEVENERFIWNREDQITLYDIDSETTLGNTFQIDKNYNDELQYGNPSGKATFITETPVTTGHQVTAVYPAQTADPTDGTITLSIPYESTIDANNQESEWKNYMRQNMYMYAPATEADGDVCMQFRHLCAMARITYTNATTEAVNLTRCELKNSGIFLALKAALDVKTGKLTPIGDKSVSIKFTNLIVEPGLSQEIYLLFFPGENFVNNAVLTLNIYTEGNETPATAEIPLSEIRENNAGAEGYEAGKRYWFRLMQTPKGLIRESSVGGIISNAKLISAIREQITGEYELVTDENGFVIVKESQDALNQVTTIKGSFDNLEGIEFLPNLKNLECCNSSLTSLDVSKNTKLEMLNCENNQLTELNVSACSALTLLFCNGNQITSLTLGNHPVLVDLYCHNNRLTELDVSACSALKHLVCNGNQITSLTLGEHPELSSLGCSNNKLAALDVSGRAKLQRLNCDRNQITSLTLGEHPELVVLICRGNKLTDLDVSKYTKLTDLDCGKNILTSLDVSNNAALERLGCDNNELTSLNLNQNTKLTSLDCESNNLQSLDVTRLTELSTLLCGKNTKLAALDISRNVKLTELGFENTSIPSLDVSKNTDLTYLTCGGEKTTSLDISKNIKLETLRCESSSLTSLDISKNVNLKTLSCSYSRIQELDITNNPNIKEKEKLHCGGQRNENNEEINMNLILTAAQKTLWESLWVTTWGNENVIPKVKE